MCILFHTSQVTFYVFIKMTRSHYPDGINVQVLYLLILLLGLILQLHCMDNDIAVQLLEYCPDLIATICESYKKSNIFSGLKRNPDAEGFYDLFPVTNKAKWWL